MIPTTTTTLSGSPGQALDSYNALQVQFAQMDSFLEYLKNLSEERREQREQQLREERFTVQRQQPLQKSLLELFSSDEVQERKEELEKTSEKQRQRMNDLDRAETRRELCNWTSNKGEKAQHGPDTQPANHAVRPISTQTGINEMKPGIERATWSVDQINAPAGPSGNTSPHKWTPSSLVSAHVTPSAPISVIQSTAQQGTGLIQPTDVREFSTNQMLINGPQANSMNLTESRLTASANTISSNTSGQNMDHSQPNNTVNMSSELQSSTFSQSSFGVLASFSDMSGLLANAVRNLSGRNGGHLKQVTFRFKESKSEPSDKPHQLNGSSTADQTTTGKSLGITKESGNSSPLQLQSVKPNSGTSPIPSQQLDPEETPETFFNRSEASKHGFTLDQELLTQKPVKPVSSFVAALDQVLASRTRKTVAMDEITKDSFTSSLQSSVQPSLQHQLVQSDAMASDIIAKEQVREDRAMQEQLDRVRFVQRVANACQSAANQNGLIRMKLHPESLGAMTVRVQIKNKMMNAQIETETESAQTALLENLELLKERLRLQGVEIGSFEVRVK